ncbi:hypothetical protein OS493_030946 [Desmophyllum pertusum]|uniref:Uncharacterized protein n=1 Tax=Desmophyllum pertusum TaxID=174260 RepID=A0A9W9ZLB8_9CNID|nr:hypothetical protein OS493_030946 [Desmophyllum pertusum]
MGSAVIHKRKAYHSSSEGSTCSNNDTSPDQSNHRGVNAHPTSTFGSGSGYLSKNELILKYTEGKPLVRGQQRVTSILPGTLPQLGADRHHGHVGQGDDHGTKDGKKFSDQLPQLLNQQNILKSSSSKQRSSSCVLIVCNNKIIHLDSLKKTNRRERAFLFDCAEGLLRRRTTLRIDRDETSLFYGDNRAGCDILNVVEGPRAVHHGETRAKTRPKNGDIRPEYKHSHARTHENKSVHWISGISTAAKEGCMSSNVHTLAMSLRFYDKATLQHDIFTLFSKGKFVIT